MINLDPMFSIARELNVGRPTVKKYLENPEQTISKRPPGPSKLNPYWVLIGQLLGQDSQAKALVILQRLQSQGFDGEITIVRDYLQKIRDMGVKPELLTRALAIFA